MDYVRQRHDGQAPFGWFVGRLRRRQFDPVLAPGAAYGEWQEIGPLQHGIFSLYVTPSPRAHAGLPEGDPELRKHRHDFPAAPADARLFARPTGPQKMELAVARERSELDGHAVIELVLD